MVIDYLIAGLVQQGFARRAAEDRATEIMSLIDNLGYQLISKETLQELRSDSKLLGLAEMYGVDNWEGWYLVINEMKEER